MLNFNNLIKNTCIILIITFAMHIKMLKAAAQNTPALLASTLAVAQEEVAIPEPMQLILLDYPITHDTVENIHAGLENGTIADNAVVCYLQEGHVILKIAEGIEVYPLVDYNPTTDQINFLEQMSNFILDAEYVTKSFEQAKLLLEEIPARELSEEEIRQQGTLLELIDPKAIRAFRFILEDRPSFQDLYHETVEELSRRNRARLDFLQ